LSQPTVQEWFNTADFSQPAAYKFGTAPRTFDSVRTSASRNFDVSLIKDTKIAEGLNLLRAESFNLFNTPMFQPPDGTYGSPTFGVVTAMQNSPRIIQFGLKLLF
jgi:hypothetical protein